MKWVNLLRRWTMRSIHAAVLGAALLGSASAAFAQMNAAATNGPVQKHYSKSRTFDLPVRMEQEFRNTLKEIRLYVKTPLGSWRVLDKISPNETKFSCKVEEDGEYWFTLATFDKQGRQTPADVNAEPPSQRVVIDTVPPQIQVQAAPTANGQLAVRCNVIDANPDLTTLKAVCHTDFGDIPLEASPTEPGLFLVKGSEMLRHPVIVTVRDRAKNEAVERVNLGNLIGATTPPTPAVKGSAEITQTTNRPDLKTPPQTAPDPAPYRGDPPVPPPIRTSDFNPPANPPAVPPMQTEQPIRPTTPALLPEGPAKTAGGSYQLINTTQASIDYRIDQVGPSGVGRVEIYMTPDNGVNLAPPRRGHRQAQPRRHQAPGRRRLRHPHRRLQRQRLRRQGADPRRRSALHHRSRHHQPVRATACRRIGPRRGPNRDPLERHRQKPGSRAGQPALPQSARRALEGDRPQREE